MRSVKLLGLCCGVLIGHYVIAASAATHVEKELDLYNYSDVHAAWLYFKPGSNNLDYAYWVSGNQPLYQSWHSQLLDPKRSSGFELGFNYAVPKTSYSASVDWMHLNTSDSAFKQATQNTDLSTLEFVAPPFEMSPPVFGVKRADSTVTFNFDTVDINLGKVFAFGSNFQMKLFGGVDIVHVGQTVTTTFSDYPGSVPTDYSYGLPPDPSFSFQLKSQSKYVGAGSDIGLHAEYDVIYGFGLVGQALGLLTAGTTSTQEDFAATSSELTALGIGVSHQAITTPNKTQIVPGFDAKLGVFYRYSGNKQLSLKIEGGYRMLTYQNAITTISPGTLVQPGQYRATPEFSTGTMAIVSVLKEDRPFNLNGPYIDLTLAMD